jgi:hypothetical protein
MRRQMSLENKFAKFPRYKSQDTNKSQITISNFQKNVLRMDGGRLYRKVYSNTGLVIRCLLFGYWLLEIGICLEIVSCILEI